jgi:hypothetical protein
MRSKLIGGAIAVVGLIALILGGNKEPARETTYGSWRDDAHGPVAITLGKNKIRTCGKLSWAKATDGTEEYLVSCDDGKYIYRVWPNINSVVGPLPASAAFAAGKD